MTRLIYAILMIGLVMQLTFYGASAQEGSDYLRQLESEAGKLSLDSKTRNQADDPGDIRDAARLSRMPEGDEGKKLVPGLDREAFEQVLRRNLMGSYVFYKRLIRDRQDRVFADYLKNPDPDRLRLSIMKMMKEQRSTQ